MLCYRNIINCESCRFSYLTNIPSIWLIWDFIRVKNREIRGEKEKRKRKKTKESERRRGDRVEETRLEDWREYFVRKVTWTAAMFLYSKFVCLSRKFMSVRERKDYNNKGFLDGLGERREGEEGKKGRDEIVGGCVPGPREERMKGGEREWTSRSLDPLKNESPTGSGPSLLRSSIPKRIPNLRQNSIGQNFHLCKWILWPIPIYQIWRISLSQRC